MVVRTQDRRRKADSRRVRQDRHRPPGIEVGIWAEGEHLVIVAGMNNVDAGIAAASGEAPNLTTNEVWKKYNYDADGFEFTSFSWLDFESLRKTFGQMPGLRN